MHPAASRKPTQLAWLTYSARWPWDTTTVFSSQHTSPRGGLRREIAQGLLRAIFKNDLPADAQLVVLKLAKQFGTSSTPVREALVELEAASMVEFIHNRGALVLPFGPKELREMYVFRRIMEVEASRCVCSRIGPAILEPLRDSISKLVESGRGNQWSQQEVTTDRQLHELISTACGNRRLSKEIKKLDVLFQTIRDVIGSNRKAQLKAVSEHLEILDALLNNDAEAAAKAMERHVDSAADIAVESMFPDG